MGCYGYYLQGISHPPPELGRPIREGSIPYGGADFFITNLISKSTENIISTPCFGQWLSPCFIRHWLYKELHCPDTSYFSMILIFGQISIDFDCWFNKQGFKYKFDWFSPLPEDSPELPMFFPSCDQQSWVSLLYVLAKRQKDVKLKRRKVKKTKRQKVDWW